MKISKIPNFKNKLFVGIKFGADGRHAALSIATKTDDKIFIESIDCQSQRNGNLWIINFLKNADIEKIAVDGAGAQDVLNCIKRAIGTNGGFGYKALIEEHEIALMDSAVLAHWLCASAKEKKKQRVNY